MKTPLIRQGEGPAQAYARIDQEHDERQRAIEKILRQNVELDSRRTTRATAAGDSAKLRGIPVQARGVGGTSPGTDPLAALLDKERQREPDAA